MEAAKAGGCALPRLQEMDVNPLVVDDHGALAADARIVVDLASPPKRLVRRWPSTPVPGIG
ncbi:MAG: acetate--CoA ligase family protein [Betaproteobacteria bacterium]|nr:acetate--CoA ligase family protein [Betaproteobacteria bacterium]